MKAAARKTTHLIGLTQVKLFLRYITPLFINPIFCSAFLMRDLFQLLSAELTIGFSKILDFRSFVT